MKYLDLAGQTFGELTVLSRVPTRPPNKHAQWLCRCTCGNEKVYPSHRLKSGEVKACGCLRGSPTHGCTGTPTYTSWQEMKTRCGNPDREDYHRYGGRGIKVCDRWICSFENFLFDMGKRPEGCTLDRIDNDGNYEPGNCKWSTQKEQTRNTRRNRMVDTPQGKMFMTDAVKASGLPYATIQYRLNHNWPPERLFEKPL